MNNLNENNSKKIIIGISIMFCTIILIIGATTAYFTQSSSKTTSNIVTTDINETIGYTDNNDYMRNNLIPVVGTDVDDFAMKNSKNGYRDNDICVYTEKYNACSLYQFTITNNANVTQELMITLNPEPNEYANLYYMMYEGNQNTLTPSSKVVKESTHIEGKNSSVMANEIILKPNESKTYTVVFYILSKNYDQTSVDAGKNFGSIIRVDSITTGQYTEGNLGQEPISKTESFIGSYADINKDGIVDGVIYADLAVATGTKKQWTDSGGKYTIPVTDSSTLKDYYVSQASCTDELCKFGNGPVLSPTGEGTERFYIMALEDFKVGNKTTFTWYKNAYINSSTGKMTDYQERTSGDFGTGKTNTDKMITKCADESDEPYNSDEPYYGGCVEGDIWKYQELQDVVDSGWHIPSRGEWSAFAQELSKYLSANEKVGITKDNYTIYGLSTFYLSSSQGSASNTYFAYFYDGYIGNGSVNNRSYVRLGATF